MANKKKYSKRGKYISLSSYDIDHIFSGLKYNQNYNSIKDNYLFECSLDHNLDKLSEQEILNLEVYIPNHGKYMRFNTQFDNFQKIFKYIEDNKTDNLILPFYGEDAN